MKKINRRKFIVGGSSTALVTMSGSSRAWGWAIVRIGISIVRWVGKKILTKRVALGVTSTAIGTSAKAARPRVTNNFILTADLGLSLSAFKAIHVSVRDSLKETNAEELLVQNLKQYDPELVQEITIDINSPIHEPKLLYFKISLLDNDVEELTLVRTIQIKKAGLLSVPIILDDTKFGIGERQLTVRIFNDPEFLHENKSFNVLKNNRTVLVTKQEMVQLKHG